ncbi:MAG: glycosyltransferase family 2 protein [Proteobacteria bacterium]|nr:glycosyltransferase family 2 protein [Pseudomonadota bacterium]
MTRLPLSCFIIAKNEADRIAQTIRSVRAWADDVVVVDGESSDNTVQIALREGARVITQSWLGFGGQKRFAEDQCRHDWVLNLDADEVVTPALKDEIIALFSDGAPSKVAYRLSLELVYPGAGHPRPWARDHWYVRLYDRRQVRFRDSPVHDSVVTEEHAVGNLYAPAYHYSYRTFTDLKRKLAGRMRLSAKYANRPSKPILMARLLLEFPINFFKYYAIRRHFTGAFKGLRHAWIHASYRQLRVVYMWRNSDAYWSNCGLAAHGSGLMTESQPNSAIGSTSPAC